MSSSITPREKFIMALEMKQPPGRVPHMELVFFLTMEAFGRLHPSQRIYGQWDQMSETERNLHRRDVADLYVQTARKYEHNVIFFHPPCGWPTVEETFRTFDHIREFSGMDYYLGIHGDSTYGVPSGTQMMQFIEELSDKPQEMKDQADRWVDEALQRAKQYKRHGALDGFFLCSDYCFNTGPFLSPAMFDEFVTPFLKRLTRAYREMGFYVVKHTDGNIMPILDALLDSGPHALHSLDPQGGVDMKEIKRLTKGKVALVGNVNCGLLDTGTEQEVIASAEYALEHGMPGGGYVFGTSNCIYTGMQLGRYELMLEVWRKKGNYPEA